MKTKLAILFLLLASAATAQETTPKLIDVAEVRGVSARVMTIYDVDGVELATVPAGNADEKEYTLTRVRINADSADQVIVTVTDRTRGDASSKWRQIDRVWVGGNPGDYWFEVKIRDRSNGYIKDWATEVITVAGKAPEPDVDDDTPPVNVDVPNEYNVGAIAFAAGPVDKALALQYAATYRAAAESLYGRPSYKFIESTKNNDTDLNVFVWIKAQVGATSDWSTWSPKITTALRAEQIKRGAFTVVDWYNAFNEIATALETKGR